MSDNTEDTDHNDLLNEPIPEDGLEVSVVEEAVEERLAKQPIEINWPVFIVSVVALVGVSAWTIFGTESATKVLGNVTGWIGQWFGWFYILLATIVVIFVLYVAFSRLGKLRLGPENSRPEFSTFSWVSMLFAAGIGTDLMFFAVAEPVTQYMQPPQTQPESIPAAEEATVWTIFHYGLTGWAMYALMGMALGYMAYRHKRPLAARSALYPIFGDRVNGWLGSVVDAAALLGSVFGLATTLGIGVVQINVGLDILFGVEQGIPAQVSLVALAIVVASISATTGVAKGIRVLSQLNVGLAVALAAWVLFWGRTDYLLNALVMNVGDLVAGFPSMTADTMAFNDVSGWMNAWTLFFWAWWVAWASFVGMFLARISRGRTLRQFVLGTLTFPLMYIIMWISIFGNAALDRVINGGEDGNGDTGFANATIDSPELGFFTLIQDYPAATLVVGVATFVALLFFVTSADSGALVMANLTSMLPTPRVDAKAWNRIVWAVISGVLTIGMLVVGGVTALQSATLIMGLPFAIVMLFVMAGLMKALRQDVHRADSLEHSERNVVAGAGAHLYYLEKGPNWRDRLTHAFGQVSSKQAIEYLDRVAEPALRAVAEEISKNGSGVNVEVVRGDLDVVDDLRQETRVYDRLKITAFEGANQFVYRIIAVNAPTPVYGGRMHAARDRSVRLEVHTTAGGTTYDVMGYSGNAIIHDYLNHFDRHQEYLRNQEETKADQ
ncbi:MAG: choline BCCT transporter BetT [Flaviflexus sp.]|uniref:choline BCCT transporter BetT n=1 Tax=Flaviflexus sp. TaxID=1969482 RepID=UPI003F92E9B8